MLISSLVAMGKNRVIGKNSNMMWRIPSEFAHYRQILGTHYYLVGRKNYDQTKTHHLSDKAIILTKNPSYTANGHVFRQIEEGIKFAKNRGEEELMVLGGAQIYELAMPYISHLHLSIVDFEQQGDTYFPRHESYQWKTLNHKIYPVSENTPFAWEYFHLEKLSTAV